MEDMKVLSIDYAYGFGDPSDLNADWHKIKEIAVFQHVEACEFIVFLGIGAFDTKQEYEARGLSASFLAACKRAVQLGYEYACFYA